MLSDMGRWALILGLALAFGTMQAQVRDTLLPEVPADILENLLEQQESEDGDFNNNDFLEDLEQLMKRKINLNNTSVPELMRTNVLTEMQALSIINYFANYGPLKSIYELKGVVGLDKNTIDLLLPYVTVADADAPLYSLKDQLTKGRHSIIYRYQQTLERAAGFNPADTSTEGAGSNRYAGDRTRQFFRYRYQFLNGISYGFTMEKDPGEMYFNPDIKLRVDYVSAHLYLENKGPFRFIALGDYEINLGQGLLCWQSFGVGKSIAVNNIKRTAQAIRPHTSVVENNFFRGAAASIVRKNFEVLAFASFNQRDASISVLDTLDEILEVSSLQTSGLHRTPTERASRNAIDLFTTGGRVGWKGRRAQVYLNSTYNRLSTPLVRDDQPYNRFAFSGKELFNASLDYSYLGNKFNFFGESAVSQNGGTAFLHGLTLRPAPSVTLSLVHRSYARNFHTLFGDSFSEGTTPVNEQGLYGGISFKVHRKVMVNSYADIYRFPWLRFRLDQPNTGGLDIMHEWVYRHNRQLEFYARFRWETKARNAPDDAAPLDYATMTKRSSLRLNMTYRANDSWTFRTRGEWSFFNDGFTGLQRGYLFYQDLGYNHPSGRWNINARYAIYKVDNFDARIYAFENDVLYYFSIPALLGTGSRVYVVTRLKLSRRVDIWLRYAQTFRNDVAQIGSGLEMLPGNTRSDIRAQVRIRL